MLIHASSLLVAQRFAGESVTLTDGSHVTILPPPCPIRVQPTDFSHTQELMDRAEAEAHEFLATEEDQFTVLATSA